MKPRKLTDQQIEEIRALAKTDIKKIDIARKYGISPQLVSYVLHHGYEQKPRQYKPIDLNARKCWQAIADEYTRANPSDPLTPEQAKKAHDAAISRLRYHFRNDPTEGERHESLL